MRVPTDRPPAQRKQGSKRHKGYHGHPAKDDPRHQALAEAEAFEIREIVRHVKREASANSNEKALVGPLGAAAARAAELLCERHPELDDDEHREAVANYLTEQLGGVLDGFSVAGYRQWRQDCVAA